MQYFLIAHEEDILTGLRLAGVQGVMVNSKAHCIQEIEKAASDQEVAILLITDALAMLCREQLDRVKAHLRGPLVVEIPSKLHLSPEI